MGINEPTPAEREGEIREEIERIRRFIRLGQNQVKHDELVLERLESELSALSAPVSDAPWTPRVGDRVVCEGVVSNIITPADKYPIEVRFEETDVDVRNISECDPEIYFSVAALRPAAAAPEGDSAAVDAEPVGYGCDRLRTLLDQLERLAYDQGFYNNSDGNQRELQHVIDATKKAILDHPAPASGKLAAGDCVEYLVKEYALDKCQHPRTYSRAVNGEELRVTIHREIAPPVAVAGQTVAPVSVVERLTAYFEDNAQLATYEWEMMKKQITVLPEPSEWAKERVVFNNPNIGGRGWSPEQRLDLAAALVAASKEVSI